MAPKAKEYPRLIRVADTLGWYRDTVDWQKDTIRREKHEIERLTPHEPKAKHPDMAQLAKRGELLSGRCETDTLGSQLELDVDKWDSQATLRIQRIAPNYKSPRVYPNRAPVPRGGYVGVPSERWQLRASIDVEVSELNGYAYGRL